MDYSAIFNGLITNALTAVLALIARRIIAGVQASPEEKPKAKPPEGVKRQFFVWLFVLLVSLPVAAVVPVSVTFILPGFIKIGSFLAAFFAFIFVWGAFDHVFAFYPGEDDVQVPADHSAGDDGEDEAQ